MLGVFKIGFVFILWFGIIVELIYLFVLFFLVKFVEDFLLGLLWK